MDFSRKYLAFLVFYTTWRGEFAGIGFDGEITFEPFSGGDHARVFGGQAAG